MATRTKQKLLSHFLSSLFAVLILIGLSIFVSLRVLQLDLWVNHTYQVIQCLDDINLNLQIAESAQRGYVITSNKDYLATYQTAEGLIQPDLNHLQVLTDDNPIQQVNIISLQQHCDRRLAYLDGNTIARQQLGYHFTAAATRTNVGKNEMDMCVASLQNMKSIENVLLLKRVNRAKDFDAAFVAVVAVTSAFLIYLIYITFCLSNNQVTSSEQKTEDVKKLHRDLRSASAASRSSQPTVSAPMDWEQPEDWEDTED